MIRKSIFLLLIVMLGIAGTSCDKCVGMFGKEKVTCSNGGTCNDGECDCLKGYSGPTCDSLDLCELNDVECIYGLCNDGTCDCQEGYEGELCETETRKKFIGEYTISEFCQPLDTVQGHKMRVERNLLDPTKIELYNVFNANQFPIVGFYSKVEAGAQTSTLKFNIYNQTPDGNERSISGSGSIDLADTNNIKISIDYTVINGTKTYTCKLTGTRI